jgi:hypothetical protein
MARRPFYGSGPAPQIARMDMQSATAPGRMFQQSLAQLGQTVGLAIAKNAENKEKKQNQELAYNLFRSQGMNEEEAKVASKVPEANRFIMDMKKMEFELNSAKQAEQDELSMNQFMTTPVERMPTGSEGRYSVLKNLRKGKGVTPPARMIKESPAVSQLPQQYKAFGSDVEKAIQSGEITPRVGMRLIQEKQAMAQSEAQRNAEFEEKVAFETFKHNLKNQPGERDMSGSIVVNDSISRANDLISPFTTGFGAYLKAIPETDAKALDAVFTTIKANIGFDKLQAMREASPTGGALGQVSNQELSSLQAVFGNLDQSQRDEDLKYNLKMLQHVYNNIVHGVGNHPYKHPMDTSPVVSPTAPATDATKQRLEQLKQMKKRRSQR